MKTKIHAAKHSEKAYALLMVMAIAGVSLLIYSSAARWTATNAMLNERNNSYSRTVAAAEGASERVLSYMARDFFNQSYDAKNLAFYRAFVPTNNWATAYEFSDGAGAKNQTWVESTATMVWTNLDSQFAGLYGNVYNCKLRSAAHPLNTPYDMTAGVEQNLQLANIPIFQFAIFYAMDLEINPGPPMKVTGKVHSNQNIYTAPGSTLEFGDAVTAVGYIFNKRHPDDPTVSSKNAPLYDGEKVETVSTLALPIGTNNSPDEIHKLVEVPPAGEDPLSPTGKERYYNKADLVVITTATGVKVKAGYWDSFTDVVTDIPGGYSFLKTDATFYDSREKKWTQVTDIDVVKLNKWMTNSGSGLNNLAKGHNGHQINSIYVDDQRPMTTKLTVVRVQNGQQLPPSGLTVATQLPLYVQGQFNAPNTTPGLTNTMNTKPSSLVGDSVTVLSAGWVDSASTNSLSNRKAVDTTVNAAFLAGVVQTTNVSGTKHYSGGVENFPRFLEDWNNGTQKTFTYNGSMVVMFPSRFAKSFWIDPGTYYNAPSRKWAFDSNFLDYNKLPPATPNIRKVVRGQWTVVAAN